MPPPFFISWIIRHAITPLLYDVVTPFERATSRLFSVF